MNTNNQRAEKIYKIYEPILLELLKDREDCASILALCEKLIKGIAVEVNLNSNTDMHFSYLFNKSGALDSEQEVFIDAVYVLSNQLLKVLVQHFHYRDVVTNHWIELSRREVFLAFKNMEFYHPQEDSQLTLEEYNKIVFPYFLPTNEFIKNLESF